MHSKKNEKSLDERGGGQRGENGRRNGEWTFYNKIGYNFPPPFRGKYFQRKKNKYLNKILHLTLYH